MSRDQFWFLLIVRQKSIECYRSQKLKLLSLQNRYIGQQGGISKIIGKAVLFLKGSSWYTFLFYHWKELNLGENCYYSNNSQKFNFLVKHIVLKHSGHTTLYLLDLIDFLPTYGSFHYAKFPSYKILRWGRLAGPSLIYCMIFDLKSIHFIPNLTTKRGHCKVCLEVRCRFN